MPASSTTRFSCTSPQRPRTCGRAERRHEAARLRAQLLLPGRNLAKPLADRGHLAGALVLELLRLLLELGQRLLDRREPRLGQLEQRRLALQQRVAGRRLQPVLPLALVLLDRGQLGAGPPEPLAAPQIDAAASEREAEQEGDDRCHGPTDDRDAVGRRRTKKSAPASPKTYRS